MIKAVLLDYGGVLTPGGFDGAIKRIFAEIYGVEESEIQFGTMLHELMDGRMSTKEFFDRMNTQFPGSPKASAFKLLDRSPESLVRSQLVHDFAKRLRDTGIRTGIFSNVAEMLAEPHFRLGDYDNFDPLLLSYRDKMAKPDPAYYDFALQSINIPASETLFLDDNERNLEPARNLGMHTILGKSPEQIVDDATRYIESQNGTSLDL